MTEMSSPAELLAQAASALFQAACALLGGEGDPEPDPEPDPELQGAGEAELISPRTYKGSNYKDFPRLVQQMGKR